MNNSGTPSGYEAPSIQNEQKLKEACASEAFTILDGADNDECKKLEQSMMAQQKTVATIEEIQRIHMVQIGHRKEYGAEVAVIGFSLVAAGMVWRFRKPILDILQKAGLPKNRTSSSSYYSNPPDPDIIARANIYEPTTIIKAVVDMITGTRLEHTTPEENLQYWLNYERKRLEDNPDALVKILTHIIEKIEEVGVSPKTVQQSKYILQKLSLPESKEAEGFDKLNDGTQLLLTILFGIMERASATPT